jgi:4'-phosphopantetheinyl transferase
VLPEVLVASLPEIQAKIPAPLENLAEPEVFRAMRYTRAADRDRFAARRAWLRQVLAERLSCDPREIRITQDQQGKPQLAGLGARLSYSQSSSGDVTAIALVEGCVAVGIDVEVHRPFNFAQLRRSTLSQNAWFRIARSGWSAAAFYDHWTAFEATVKATGEGVAVGAHRYDVDPVEASVRPLGRSADPELMLKVMRGDRLSVAVVYRATELWSPV